MSPAIQFIVMYTLIGAAVTVVAIVQTIVERKRP